MNKKSRAMNNNYLQGVSCHHDLTKMQMNHRDLTKDAAGGIPLHTL